MINKSNEEHYNASKQAVIDHFFHLFFGGSDGTKGPRLFNVEIVSSKHKEDNDKDYETNKEKYKRGLNKLISQQEISKFKNECILYPDKYLTRFVSNSTE